MSFAATRDSAAPHRTRRWTTFASVAVLHAGVFYVLVTGLAGVVTMIQPPPRLTAHDDALPLPVTPPTARPTAKPQADTPRLAVLSHADALPLQIDLPPLTLPSPDVRSIGNGMVVQDPGIGDALPPPTPRYSPHLAKPRGAPGAWISPADYPAPDLREGNSGVTGFRVVVGRDGRPQSCAITASSGHPRLDAATCELILRRAVFNPASDDTGAATTGSYQSKVVWTIPEH